MNRRSLIIGLIVLLMGVALAFYAIWQDRKPALPPSPPAESPLSAPIEQKEPARQETPAAPERGDEADEASEQTIQVPLEKEDLVKEPSTPDASLSLKKPKAREVLPGVTIENKELTIQLEKANESLSIRRSNTSDEQVQMMWKQKF